MNFVDRLDDMILNAGTTRKALASKVGIGVGAISAWKARQNFPTADVIVSIAQALGVSVEYLVTGYDNSDPWIRENAQFIRDCKELEAALFESVKIQVKALAESSRESRQTKSG